MSAIAFCNSAVAVDLHGEERKLEAVKSPKAALKHKQKRGISWELREVRRL